MQGLSLLTLTQRLASAVDSERFITHLGAQTGADGNAMGVTRSAGVAGELVPVDCLGTAVVESGGAFLAGATLKSDALGRAIGWETSGAKLAVARQDATDAGRRVEVFLIPNAA